MVTLAQRYREERAIISQRSRPLSASSEQLPRTQRLPSHDVGHPGS
jgi:hypothetical protein